MTTVTLSNDPSLRDAALARLIAIIGIGVPDVFDLAATPPTVTYNRDLTPEQQAAVQLAIDQAGTETGLTAEDYAIIRGELPTLRALRQLGRSAFMALSAAERDRMIYDALVALTRIAIIDHREPE